MSRTKTPWYVLHAPEIGPDFDEFYKVCCKGGVLDKKTKEIFGKKIEFDNPENGSKRGDQVYSTTKKSDQTKHEDDIPLVNELKKQLGAKEIKRID